MKDIGDIVYVIAIIGWIIYSFVSKNKKQQSKRKQVDETTARPQAEPDIKTVLEELLGKTQEPEQAPAYETRKPTIEPVYAEDEYEEGESQEGKAMNPVESYEFGKYKTLEDDATSQYARFNSVNYSEQDATDLIAKEENRIEVANHQEDNQKRTLDFDIEKAIIYSEILKRPKWAA